MRTLLIVALVIGMFLLAQGLAHADCSDSQTEFDATVALLQRSEAETALPETWHYYQVAAQEYRRASVNQITCDSMNAKMQNLVVGAYSKLVGGRIEAQVASRIKNQSCLDYAIADIRASFALG